MRHQPMIRPGNFLGSALVAMALLFCADWATRAADESTPAVPAEKERPPGAIEDPKSLVGQLGHDLFAVREGATNRLIEKGITAKPVLVAALTSTDAEVRFRAKRILSIIVDADFQKRKRAFIADVDGQAQATLPGWSVFKTTIGSNQAARDLFVEMQDAEGTLLEAYEQGPKAAAVVLKERSRVAFDRVQPQGRRNPRIGNMSMPVMAALMFVGSDPAISLSDDVAARLATIPMNPTFGDVMRSGTERRDLMRKLFGRWVARDMSPDLIANNLAYASQYNLKEALEPALSMLKSREATGPANRSARTNAMLLVSRFGNKDHIKEVEPYLTDSHLIFDSGGVNQPTQAQVRDLALAVTIKLSGQDPNQFGFQNFANDRFNANMVAFRSDDERDAAFSKWEAWHKAQKQASGKKAGAKSDG